MKKKDESKLIIRRDEISSVSEKMHEIDQEKEEILTEQGYDEDEVRKGRT